MNKFNDYLNFRESKGIIQWGYMGSLENYLGNGIPEHLNYGTGGHFRSWGAFLYVKIDPQQGGFREMGHAIKKFASRVGVECLPSNISKPGSNTGKWDDEMTVDGGFNFRDFGNWQCKLSNDERAHKARFDDTGEFHVTIAQAMDLANGYMEIKKTDERPGHEEIIDFLLEAKTASGRALFDKKSKDGMEMKVTPIKGMTFGFSTTFNWSKPINKGQSSPPIVILANVEIENANEVREAIGLSPWGSGYVPHATVALAYTLQTTVDADLPPEKRRDERPVITTNLRHEIGTKRGPVLQQTVKRAHDLGRQEVISAAKGIGEVSMANRATIAESREYQQWKKIIPGFEPIMKVYLD